MDLVDSGDGGLLRWIFDGHIHLKACSSHDQRDEGKRVVEDGIKPEERRKPALEGVARGLGKGRNVLLNPQPKRCTPSSTMGGPRQRRRGRW